MAGQQRDDDAGGLATTLQHSGEGRDDGGETAVARLAAGTRIDHFVVEATLGGGGMGVVLAAHDTRLGRKVAIKVIRPDDRGVPSDEAARLRLLREAQAMARLSHPNVVVVHEVGTIGDQVYVAMEHVEGETLRAWMMRSPRRWRGTLDVLVQAGRGLAAAHEAGLVHRDFKPENVLVGSDGRVRVTDFGLVTSAGEMPAGRETGATSEHSAAAPAPLDVTLTQTGMLLGTPLYMAPEQHARRPVTAAADQFAFCVTAYEALYGERPFAGDRLSELMEHVAAGRVRSPPRDSDVPAWLREVVVRGLRAAPETRHPSMTALLVALGLDPDRTRRRRLRLAAGGVVVVGALAFAGFALSRGEGARTARCDGGAERLVGVWDAEVRVRVERAFAATGRPYAAATLARVVSALDAYAAALTAARTDACVATRVRGEQSEALLDLRMACLERRGHRLAALTGLFAAGADPDVLDTAQRAVGALPAIADCADRETLGAATPLPGDPAVRERIAELRARLDEAEAVHSAGKWNQALSIALEVLPEARAVDHAPLLAEVLVHVGAGYRSRDAHAESAAALAEAAQVAARARDDALMAEALISLLYTKGVKQAQFRDAFAMEAAADAAVTRAGDPPRLRAKLHEYLGEAYRIAGDGAAARRHLERALSLLDEMVGREHEASAHVIDSIGLVLDGGGDFAAGRTRHEEALAILERVHGPAHPEVARTLYNLGSSLQDVGRYDDARTYYQRALAVDRAALGDAHASTGYALNALGDLERIQGNHTLARQHLEQALVVWERAMGPEHAFLMFPLRNLGTLLDARGQHAEALVYHQRALAIGERALGPEHSDVADAVYYLAENRRLSGELDEALRLHQRATAIWEREGGPSHPYVAWGLTGIGEVEIAARRAKRALAPLERALAIRVIEEGDPLERSRTRFALARALWDTGGDRARAKTLATEARVDALAAGPRAAQMVVQIDAWASRRR